MTAELQSIYRNLKKQYRDWYYTNEATYYLADNPADTNTDH